MEEDQNITKKKGEDRFSDLMFGSRRDNDPDEEPEMKRENQPSIDYGELMIHFDSLMESAKNLKPLFQKVIPFVEQIWKKK
ncbi:hypothetical protein [Neobacillus sp. PS3-40]|uniref:hypothetical protein n=1 Tax=Neobacillus sp. PS3-40 TaxID=3070679 RepID=UPI0027E0FCB3|nr:hypothetical protein [Neobacillus sp. PS3-40]WML43370.1 hypothetical protein RCG20_16435 [Neobacillus sp. PS3-40]